MGKITETMQTQGEQVSEDNQELRECPFCGSDPVFPDSKDVRGTCYDAGCEECGVAKISIQIIDCFDYPRDHVHDSWDNEKTCYAQEYIEEARRQAIAAWNRRAPAEQTDFIMMPKTLTAENGAKVALSGEFFEKVAVPCEACGDYDDICEVCDGTGSIDQAVWVSWTTIKAIYKKAVELLGRPSPPKDKS